VLRGSITNEREVAVYVIVVSTVCIAIALAVRDQSIDIFRRLGDVRKIVGDYNGPCARLGHSYRENDRQVTS
jgi:hypothetical protein